MQEKRGVLLEEIERLQDQMAKLRKRQSGFSDLIRRAAYRQLPHRRRALSCSNQATSLIDLSMSVTAMFRQPQQNSRCRRVSATV